MLEYFDRLLFNAIVEYNNTINRCMDDPIFAGMVDSSEIGDAQERYIIQIVNAAERAGAISIADWREIRYIVDQIALDREDAWNDLRYEVEA